jgi:hypothetical protein
MQIILLLSFGFSLLIAINVLFLCQKNYNLLLKSVKKDTTFTESYKLKQLEQGVQHRLCVGCYSSRRC